MASPKKDHNKDDRDIIPQTDSGYLTKVTSTVSNSFHNVNTNEVNEASNALLKNMGLQPTQTTVIPTKSIIKNVTSTNNTQNILQNDVNALISAASNNNNVDDRINTLNNAKLSNSPLKLEKRVGGGGKLNGNNMQNQDYNSDGSDQNSSKFTRRFNNRRNQVKKYVDSGDSEGDNQYRRYDMLCCDLLIHSFFLFPLSYTPEPRNKKSFFEITLFESNPLLCE